MFLRHSVLLSVTKYPVSTASSAIRNNLRKTSRVRNSMITTQSSAQLMMFLMGTCVFVEYSIILSKNDLIMLSISNGNILCKDDLPEGMVVFSHISFRVHNRLILSPLCMIISSVVCNRMSRDV